MRQIYSGVISVLLLLLIPFGTACSQEPSLNISRTFFTENKGQVKDQDKNKRKDIDFVLNGKGLNIFISSGKIAYQFSAPAHPHPTAAVQKEVYEKSKFDFLQPYKNPLTAQEYNLYRLDMELVGADFSAVPVKELPSAQAMHYYLPGLGNKGLQDIRSYQKITYPNVYPGIDWVLYIRENKLKYDFIMHEGADAGQILIRYRGADRQQLTAAGSLEISTPLGAVTEDAPVAWTERERRNVPARFKPSGNSWAFELDQYTGGLVLDPGLSWSTYYGGSGMEVVKDICTDNTGIYVTGLTTSLNQIATTGTYQTTYYGGTEGDAFLAKFSASGTLLWATYFGGSGNDLGWGIVTDLSGNVYIAGYTESSSGMATPGSHQPVFGGAPADGFLAKFNAAGQRVWSTYYGGSGADFGHAIAIDGNILYTCGSTYSNNGIATPGSFQPGYTTGPDEGNGFLAKWNTDGQRLWGTYYGGGTTTSSSVTIGHNHEVYMVGGTTSSSNIGSPGSFQPGKAGLIDNFLVKFNPSGQRIWGTYFGGTAAESTFPVALAGTDNNVYLAGITYSYNLIATPGSSRQNFCNTIDGYLSSFDTAGNRQWGTYVGPGFTFSGVYISDLALSYCSGVYVTGDVYPSSNLAPTDDAYQQFPGGGPFDAALLRYDNQGRAEYSTYIGGTGAENMGAVALSKEGNLYLAGLSESDSGIATTGVHQSLFGGVQDAFLMKFLDIFIRDKENTETVFDSLQCINDSFFVPYVATAPFQSGNIFTAELSDNNGSFANPLVIGTLITASSSGTIPCFITQSVPPGSGYKIRVQGTAPATSGSCPVNLTLMLPPIPDITINGNILTSSAAANNQWIKNGIPVTGATAQQFSTTGSGWYQVQFTDPVTGCTSISDSVAIGNVGIRQTDQLKEAIAVYPSPFSQQVNIHFASSIPDVQKYQVVITSPLGKKAGEQKSLQYKTVMDLGYLADGIYFIHINGPAGQAVYKVIKANKGQ